MIQQYHRHLINRANELVARQCIERTTMAGRELEGMSQELAWVCTELVKEIENSSTRISELEGRTRVAGTRSLGCTSIDSSIVSVVESRAPTSREFISALIVLSNHPGIRAEIDDSIFRSNRLSEMNRKNAIGEIVRRRLEFLSRNCVLEHVRMPRRETGWYVCDTTEVAAQ